MELYDGSRSGLTPVGGGSGDALVTLSSTMSAQMLQTGLEKWTGYCLHLNTDAMDISRYFKKREHRFPLTLLLSNASPAS